MLTGLEEQTLALGVGGVALGRELKDEVGHERGLVAGVAEWTMKTTWMTWQGQGQGQ